MKKNKFLFGRRSKKKKWAPLCWDIAGGHSLPGESPLQTLTRETYEETGVIILHARLIRVLILPDDYTGTNFEYHIFFITSWSGKVLNISSEHSKLRWLTMEQVVKRKLALPEYLSMMDEWLKTG